VVLVAVALGACQTTSVQMTCVPGASAACACTDGRAGAQLCGKDGTFEACVCVTVDGGTQPTVDAGTSDATVPDGG
jgi:hypothetical protein